MRRSSILGLVVIALVGTIATSVRADLTPINVPQNYQVLQTAINNAQAGVHYVLVTKDTTFAPIVMKSGVPVLAEVGKTPIIDAGAASYAVQFPSDSNTATELVGFTLRGGSQAVVNMAGPGRLSHCTVTNDGDACSSAIKISGSGTAVIDSCTVTLVNSVTNRAGISVQSGDPDITGCEIRVPGASNGIGIKTDSGADGTISWCFITATKNGIYALGTTLTQFCTVDSTYFEGIVNGNDAVVENSIVTNVLYDNPPYTPHPGISGGSAYYCIAPNGISVPYGYSVGNSTADPLYCDPAERTLRVDSYGNPEHNASEELIGRFPVACMTGTLVRTSTFAGGPLEMLGTVTVPSGTTLTLRPGTAVTVDTTGTPELRVHGTLLVAPGGGATSTFRSSSQTAGSWGGIASGAPNAHIVLQDVDLYDFETGIVDDYPIDSLFVYGAQFGNFTHAAIALDNGSGDGGGVRLLETAVDMDGAPYGIRIDSGPDSYGVDFDYVTVTGDAAGEVGIYLNTDPPASDPAHSLDEITISGLTAGTGLWVGAYGPIIEDGLISGCKTGVSFEDTQSGRVGGGSSSSLLEISGCTTGMYFSGSADVPVTDATIGSIPSGGIGVYTDEEAGGDFTHVSIAGGATGFKSYGTGDQTFRQGNITGFTTYGVLVAIASPINLGDYDGDDPGNNNIYSSSGSAKYVYAKNHLAELGPVLAQANWWGEYPPSSTKFTTATVDYTYALTGEYQMQRRHVAMVELPAVMSLTAGPNPARDRVLVRAEVPTPQASATLEVFDVTGRRVRSLFTGSLTAGRKELSWDGADDRGAALPTGIYFVRLRAGQETRVTRVIRVR